MSDPYVGQITLFAGTFVPVGYLACDGSLQSISAYQTLYAVIGTTYGGDGQSTFGLPNLSGQVPVGMGTGSGLTPRTLGQSGGSQNVSLSSQQLPAHAHPVVASTAAATSLAPGSGLVYGAVTPNGNTSALYTPTPVPPDGQAVTMAGNAVSSAGGGQPHENRMPTLPIQFIIATDGTYPTQS